MTNPPIHNIPEAERLRNLDFQQILLNSLNDDCNEFHISSPYDLHGLNCGYWITNGLYDALKRSSQFNNILIHLNIQCLSAKFDALTYLLNAISDHSPEYLPSLIALSETWLCQGSETSFNLAGYQPLLANCRNDNDHHGGVALYILHGHDFIKRPDLNIFIPFVFESIFVTLKPSNITVGVIYKTPSARVSDFLISYELTLNALKSKSETFILLGDFNLNLLNYPGNNNVADFVNLNFENGCIPLITRPTRVTPTSATCIDNIVTNKVVPNSTAGILIDDTSDHFPIFYSFSDVIRLKPMNPIATATFRNLSQPNLTHLKKQLSERAWDSVLNEDNPSVAAEELNIIIRDELDKACPYVTKRLKKTFHLSPGLLLVSKYLPKGKILCTKNHLKIPKSFRDTASTETSTIN